jgi:hypothetical protein
MHDFFVRLYMFLHPNYRHNFWHINKPLPLPLCGGGGRTSTTSARGVGGSTPSTLAFFCLLAVYNWNFTQIVGNLVVGDLLSEIRLTIWMEKLMLAPFFTWVKIQGSIFYFPFK